MSVLTNLGVFVFGAIGTLVIFLQLAAMRDSNAEMERANRANLELARESLAESRQALQVSQRARLALEERGGFGIEETSRWLRIKNTGLTPAHRVRSVIIEVVSAKPIVAEAELDAGFARSPSISVSTDVAAGQTITASFDTRGKTDDLVASLSAKKSFIYVGARTEYEDVFGNKRELRYCVTLTKPPDTWTLCSFGNWAS